jgi:sugar phosphate isomerase/epimerase
MSIKILIDPTYVNPRPFHILPKFFPLPVMSFPPLFWRSRSWTGPFPWWAFGPEGFDGMDLGLTYTYLFRPDLSLREVVLEQYRRARWPIRAFHATFSGEARFFRETALDLSSNGERTRRGLLNHIRVATKLGGPGTVLVLHPGSIRTRKSDAMDNMLKNLEICLPEAEKKQVVLALENMPRSMGRRRYMGSDYGDLCHVLETLPSPCLKVCLDLGHANNYGEVHARERGTVDVEGYLRRFGYCREMIRALGCEIVYAHIHYNRSHILSEEARSRNFDEHMPLSHVPAPCWPAFRETLRLLLRETSVLRKGCVNLELVPGSLFGFYRVMPMGAGLWEQMASVRLLRDVLEECGPSGDVTPAGSGLGGQTA